MESEDEQTVRALSWRGMCIGAVGSAVITASSLYVALKLGALPWPIVFAALISYFFLRLLGRGKCPTSLNEANVTHTAMSAGAMVAGGLAFTIPGYWILGGQDAVAFWQVLLVALAGVTLGLVATACLRRYFIDEARLPFPIGVSAAETLKASAEVQAQESKALFGSMGLAAIYALLRDNLALLPQMLLTGVRIPGVAFGIYNSPMLLAVGFIIGPVACLVWFIGALIGDFGVVVGGTAVGAWSLETAASIKTSLGMGLMFGAGLGVVLLQLVPMLRRRWQRGGADEPSPVSHSVSRSASQPVFRSPRTTVLVAAIGSAATAALAATALGLGLVASVLLVVGVWIAVLISSQSVGVTGIDPMEVFGVLVVLVIMVFCHELSLLSLFMIAAVVAVAAGLTGDVMNDFKAGAILGTNPREQWIAQAIGGVIGALVASIILLALATVFGTEAFGSNVDGSPREFVAAQASVVAAMVGGIPHVPAFAIGLAAGLLLTLLRLPVLTLGLGVYLPFYLSLTAFLGALVKLVCDLLARRAKPRPAPRQVPEPQTATSQATEPERFGVAVAAGLLGGESLVGVISALIVMAVALLA
ncbi:MAG: OPT/YSL family transporter [Coriobacteriales bacterium]|jgi:putative OPT family oligopeptide transporter|nr:OPT/YSL family transporter [Coriobacteriales bacterium]